MKWGIELFALVNLTAALCSAMGGVYAAAAVASMQNDHRSATSCYYCGCVIYALLSVCHSLHV